MSAKPRKWRQPKQPPKLTQKLIRELLEQSVPGANELNKELKRMFRPPDRILILD